MRSTKILGYVDSKGEIHEGVVPVLCGVRTPSPFGSKWMQVNQNFLDELADRKDIGVEVFRVFLKLNAHLDFENIIQVQQTEIAENLGMHKQAVNRAIRKLEELGIILRGPKVGRSSSWRLHPNAGWKGNVTQLRQARHQHLKLVTSEENTVSAPPVSPSQR